MKCFYCENEVGETDETTCCCESCFMSLTQSFDVNKIRDEESTAKEILYWGVNSSNESIKFWDKFLSQEAEGCSESLKYLLLSLKNSFTMININLNNFLLYLKVLCGENKANSVYKREIKIAVYMLSLLRMMIIGQIKIYKNRSDNFSLKDVDELYNFSDLLLSKISKIESLCSLCSDEGFNKSEVIVDKIQAIIEVEVF